MGKMFSIEEEEGMVSEGVRLGNGVSEWVRPGPGL